LTKLYTDSFSLSSHVIVFTETWLKPEVLSSEVFPSKYTTYRLDRPSRRGGGVLIAVDSELTSEVITSDEINDIEISVYKTIPSGYFYIHNMFIYSAIIGIPDICESSVRYPVYFK